MIGSSHDAERAARLRARASDDARWRFPNWESRLALEPMPESDRALIREAIVRFRAYLVDMKLPATYRTARAFLQTGDPEGQTALRGGLQWFFGQGVVVADSNTDAATSEDAHGEPGRSAAWDALVGSDDADDAGDAGDAGERTVLALPAIEPQPIDVAVPAWERLMVERLRVKHYQWRTEQSYRDWLRPLQIGGRHAFLASISFIATQRYAISRFD